MKSKLLILYICCSATMGWSQQTIHCTSNSNDERALIELKGQKGRFELYNAKAPRKSFGQHAVAFDLASRPAGYTQLIIQKAGHRETVILPGQIIGKKSTGFIARFIHLTLKKNISYERSMSCYSVIKD